MNNLILGNALELLKHVQDGSIDLIIIDPPYKVTKKGCTGNMGGMMITEETKKGNIFKYNDINIEEYIEELYRVLKEGSHCYIMTNNKNLFHFLQVIEKSKFKLFKTLIWKKNTPISNQYYMDQHEYIFFLRKGKAKKINNCGTKSVLEIDNVKNKIHPTEKPVELLKVLIENSSNEGDVVLDCFAGSGSLGEAFLKTNRNYLLMEIDPEFYEVAKNRLK